MYCKNCMNYIDDNSVQCPYCHHAVSNTEKSRHVGLIIAIIITAVILCALAATLVILLNSDSNSDNTEETTAAVTTAAPQETIVAEESAVNGEDSVTVPDVSGKLLSDATNDLSAAGLKIDIAYEESSSVPDGYVISQSIDPGRKVKKGVTVMLYVSKAQQGNNPQSNNSSSVKNATYFSGASASSVLAGDGQSYNPENVLSKDSTCWSEGATGDGINEWIKLDLPGKQRVSGLQLINGYAGTEKQYSSNGKIKDVEIELSDGQKIIASLVVLPTADRKSVQQLTFNQPVVTDYVKIIIKDVDSAQSGDTCLTYVAPF